MKIGIISDTHGDIPSGRKAIKAMGKIDLLIHAGDTYRDAMLLKEVTKLDVVAVKGNTDFDCEAPSEATINVEGKKIFLSHGDKYNVKYSLDKLYYKALETNSNIMIFGHTHIPTYVKEGGIVFINPGSVSRPRGGSKPSYVVMNIDEKGVKVNLYELK